MQLFLTSLALMVLSNAVCLLAAPVDLQGLRQDLDGLQQSTENNFGIVEAHLRQWNSTLSEQITSLQDAVRKLGESVSELESKSDSRQEQMTNLNTKVEEMYTTLYVGMNEVVYKYREIEGIVEDHRDDHTTTSTDSDTLVVGEGTTGVGDDDAPTAPDV